MVTNPIEIDKLSTRIAGIYIENQREFDNQLKQNLKQLKGELVEKGKMKIVIFHIKIFVNLFRAAATG